MKEFKRSNKKTNSGTYITYLIFDFLFITGIAIIPGLDIDWKVLIIVPVAINALFDLYYLVVENHYVIKLNFTEQSLQIYYRNGELIDILYPDLSYSIRHKKYYKSWTEIELKRIANSESHTFARIHIKNWKDIFEIEEELKQQRLQKENWEPRGFWRKYGEWVFEGILALFS